MRFAVLGSGSKGNCLVVDGGGVVVMIDAGFSPRETRARMRHLEIDITDVNALLITHGHGDHVKGARQIAGALGIRTWSTEATRSFCSRFATLKNHVPITGGERFSVGRLNILAVKTPHDEPGSVCYVIDDGDEAFAICTDLGFACNNVGAALHGVDTFVCEFNHDAHMLKTGPYTPHLKRRIASRFGHVDNVDGAKLLSMANSTALSRVLCAHLSEVNNTPDKALDAAREVVDGRDVDVAVAPQHAPTPWLRVRRRPVARTRRAIEIESVLTGVSSPLSSSSGEGGGGVRSTATTFELPARPAPAVTPPAKHVANPIAMKHQMALFASSKEKP
ncbi:MAG: MBL fold metallo-hydrolase [Deltaproteobacteria bacterium]|nr:MBL fold metallo-hydrolase [Deltaproteobacteria bacterium]